MTNSNKKKTVQLGMSNGKAQHKLRKMIMFKMIQKLGLDICFQCGKKIDTIEKLSIEHKIPWLDSKNPKELFFNLENIAFSHLKCNVLAVRPKYNNLSCNHIKREHGINGYKKGCRCTICKESKKKEKRIYLDKKKGIKTVALVQW